MFGRLRLTLRGARDHHRPLVGIGQHDVEVPLLVRADVGLDLGAELYGLWLYSAQFGGSTSR